jgi:hypothetical protein
MHQARRLLHKKAVALKVIVATAVMARLCSIRANGEIGYVDQSANVEAPGPTQPD